MTNVDTPEYLGENRWVVGGVELSNVHSAEVCDEGPCVIHAPTDHAMREFPLRWREDRGIFERVCPCGIGHPDPDQRDHWLRNGMLAEQVHGCCGKHCA